MAGTRKVTLEVCGAFMARKPKHNNNTHTDGKSLFLFGNKIAEHREDGVYITDAGWNTTTTRERLNYFASVHTRKGQLFLDNKPWDGDWTRVEMDSNGWRGQ